MIRSRIGGVQIIMKKKRVIEKISFSGFLVKIKIMAVHQSKIAINEAVYWTIVEGSVSTKWPGTLFEYCSKKILIKIIPNTLNIHDSNVMGTKLILSITLRNMGPYRGRSKANLPGPVTSRERAITRRIR
jgi:hypothetical protein